MRGLEVFVKLSVDSFLLAWGTLNNFSRVPSREDYQAGREFRQDRRLPNRRREGRQLGVTSTCSPPWTSMLYSMNIRRQP